MLTPSTVTNPEKSPVHNKRTLVAPRPSSPREFFARIYGHLESEKTKNNPEQRRKDDEYRDCGSVSNSSSEVEVSEGHGRPIISSAYHYESNEDLMRLEAQDGGFSGENSSATAALVQLASRNFPVPGVSEGPRYPGVSGVAPMVGLSNFPRFSSMPSFLPPRPPFFFPADLPFPSGFSAFLSRRRRGPGRSRRQRTTFSAAQTLRLEVEFRRAEYVGRPRRLELAAALRLSETQVKIWFQNRRAKDKRIEKAHLDHHYRTLAGLPPEYYNTFAPPSCAMCLYKRESPCLHFFVQPKASDAETEPPTEDELPPNPQLAK